MRDKDAESFVRVLQPVVDLWYTVGLHIARASPPEELAATAACNPALGDATNGA